MQEEGKWITKHRAFIIAPIGVLEEPFYGIFIGVYAHVAWKCRLEGL